MIPPTENGEFTCRIPDDKSQDPATDSRNFRFWRGRTWPNLEYFHKWRRKLTPSNFDKIPFFIILISLLEIIVFYAADDRLKILLFYDTERKREIWRFVTYMLLHTDAVHLALNVIIQGFLGAPLELEQGRLRCAVIYFGGGLAGSLGASVFAAFSLMAGASGGVYAFLTSQIPNVVLNYGTIKYAVYRVITVAALTTSDVVYILCHVWLYNNEKPRIGWVAHASGAAAGLLLGFLIFEGNSKWRKKFQMLSCAALAMLCLLAFTFYLLKFLSPHLSHWEDSLLSPLTIPPVRNA